VLKPGDRVLTRFNFHIIEFFDPCFVKNKIGDEAYMEGYIPLYSEHCRCKHAECDSFAILRLSLYLKGSFKIKLPPPPDAFVVMRYIGNGVVEATEMGDYDYYDYYLAKIFGNIDVESVQGAVWYSVYNWNVAELSLCCDESNQITLALIRRGEKAKIKYYDKDDEKIYEMVISTEFPPTAEEYSVDD
jgi:hypothetical protein